MALDKNGIAKRIAQEVQNGFYVNLGIGIPTLVANYVREDIENIIINKRKLGLKKKLYETIYEEALKTKKFEVYSDQ